ncbi:MAG: MlaD family protein, partial [Aquificaceae bacterium]|nr:MlaD family protein [Aquificaceae bacterium]
MCIRDRVRVAGIRSGRVKSVSLKEGKVEVVFELEKDAVLYRDAVAEIGTLGLMGDKYLNLHPGTPASGVLEEGGTVQRSLGYADTDRLVKEITQASERVRLLAETLQIILSENREDIRMLVKNLQELSYTLNLIAQENRESLKGAVHNVNLLAYNLNRSLPKTIESIDRLARSLEQVTSENRQELKETVTNLRDLSRELKTTLPELSRNLNAILTENRQDIRTTTSNLSELSRSLRDSSERLNRILAHVERGEGTIGKLIKEEDLYRNLSTGLGVLAKAGQVAERTNLYVSFRGELYRAGDSKGILSVKLQPDGEKYYLLEVVGDSRGRVYREEFLPNQYLVRKEFKPELTLQYARTFPVPGGKELTFRGGLKESTGGVGTDLVLSDRLYLYSDLWDFGRRDRPQDKDLKPNLQVGVHYRVRGPLYVRVGGDDLLNAKLRGAFGGVGLMFTDNDLKYLIGSLRVPLR